MRWDYVYRQFITHPIGKNHDPFLSSGSLFVAEHKANLPLTLLILLVFWASTAPFPASTPAAPLSNTVLTGETGHIRTASKGDSHDEPSTFAWRMPDTGMISCYNDSQETICPSPGEDYYGQDGCYSLNPPSFTKLDASGNDLPDAAESWSMVRDNVTGLIWEVKTPYESIHYQEDRYTWQDAQDIFIDTLNNSGFGGYTDWRLPTMQEWSHLLNYSRTLPALDAFYFPFTTVGDPGKPWTWIMMFYWSSTTYVFDSNEAWGAFCGDGSDGIVDKTTSRCVRAVRGESPGSSLMDNGDGTVTDLSTGLMWQKDFHFNSMSWKEALSYCEGLTLAGYNDWRLPNIKELRSIVNHGMFDPALDPTFFPLPIAGHYWSSTTYVMFPERAWFIDFDKGSDLEAEKRISYYVRAVRGGR